MSAPNVIPMPRKERPLIEQDLTKAFEQMLHEVRRYAEYKVEQIREAAETALQEMGPVQPLWDTAQAASYLGFTKRWLDEHTRAGKDPVVPFVMIGSEKRFRRVALDAWLAQHETKAREIKL